MHESLRSDWIRGLAKGILPLVVLAAASVTCVSATPIVSVTGVQFGTVDVYAAEWEAFSFTVGQSYTDVAVNADLVGTFSGTAFLTNQIGVGTTPANELASGAFSASSASGAFQPVLQHLNLTAGTYFVVLTSLNPTPSSGIVVTTAPVVTTDPGASNNSFYVAFSPFAPYPPASSFIPNTTIPQLFAEYSVGLAADSGSAPEPSTWVLFGAGILALFFVNRRQRA